MGLLLQVDGQRFEFLNVRDVPNHPAELTAGCQSILDLAEKRLQLFELRQDVARDPGAERRREQFGCITKPLASDAKRMQTGKGAAVCWLGGGEVFGGRTELNGGPGSKGQFFPGSAFEALQQSGCMVGEPVVVSPSLQLLQQRFTGGLAANIDLLDEVAADADLAEPCMEDIEIASGSGGVAPAAQSLSPPADLFVVQQRAIELERGDRATAMDAELMHVLGPDAFWPRQPREDAGDWLESRLQRNAGRVCQGQLGMQSGDADARSHDVGLKRTGRPVVSDGPCIVVGRRRGGKSCRSRADEWWERRRQNPRGPNCCYDRQDRNPIQVDEREYRRCRLRESSPGARHRLQQDRGVRGGVR